MAKKKSQASALWGIFEASNRWLVGGLFILVGLIIQSILLGYLSAALAAYWPLLLILAGLLILL